MHSFPTVYQPNPQESKEDGHVFRQYMFDKSRALATYSQEEILEDSPITRNMRDIKYTRTWMTPAQLNEFYCTLRLLCEYSGKQPRSRTDLCFNCYGLRFRVPTQKHVVLNHYESIPLHWIFDCQHPAYETFEYFHLCWQKFLEKFLDFFRACGFTHREKEGQEILFRLPFFMTCRYNHRKEGHDTFLSHYLQKDMPNPLASYPLYRGPLTLQAEQAMRRKEGKDPTLKDRIEKDPQGKHIPNNKQKEIQAPRALAAKDRLSTQEVKWRVESLYRAPDLQFPTPKKQYLPIPNMLMHSGRQSLASENSFRPSYHSADQQHRTDFPPMTRPFDHKLMLSKHPQQRMEHHMPPMPYQQNQMMFHPMYQEHPRTHHKNYGSSSSHPAQAGRRPFPEVGTNPYNQDDFASAWAKNGFSSDMMHNHQGIDNHMHHIRDQEEYPGQGPIEGYRNRSFQDDLVDQNRDFGKQHSERANRLNSTKQAASKPGLPEEDASPIKGTLDLSEFAINSPQRSQASQIEAEEALT